MTNSDNDLVPSEQTFEVWYAREGYNLPLQCPLGMSKRDLMFRVWEAGFLAGEDEASGANKTAKQITDKEFFSDVGGYLEQEKPLVVTDEDGKFKFGIV